MPPRPLTAPSFVHSHTELHPHSSSASPADALHAALSGMQSALASARPKKRARKASSLADILGDIGGQGGGEERGARFRGTPTKAIVERISRAQHQRMYLVTRHPIDHSALSADFVVLGSVGNGTALHNDAHSIMY